MGLEDGEEDGDEDDADGRESRAGVPETNDTNVEETNGDPVPSGRMGDTVSLKTKETKNRPIAGRKTKTAERNTALKARMKPIRILLIPFRVAWGKRRSQKY